MSPIEELQALNTQVERAMDLEELRPIFERMTAISHEYPDDFEVVLAVDQVRRNIVDRGNQLREQQEALEEQGYEPEPGYAPEGEPPPALPPPLDAYDAFTAAPRVPPPVAASDTTQVFSAPPGPPPIGAPPLAATGSFGVPPPVPPPLPAANLPAPPPPLPPPAPRATPPPAPVPPKPPAAKSGAGRKLAAIGGGAALLALLAGGGFWFFKMQQGGGASKKPVAATVAVDVATVPPGASIQINGETKCKSNCRLDLAPGSYQLTAVLEGFEPGASALTVVAGNPMNVNLALVGQSGSLHVMSDLDAATVMLDGQPAGNIQDGQFILDRVAPGAHVLKLVGKGGDVEFPFEVVIGKQPVITGPVKAGNLLAVLVTSMGQQAKVYSNSTAKVAVNGQAQGQTGAQGLDLKDVPVGEQTLSLGEGSSEKRLVVSFGPAPAIAAFFKKPDVTTGTLVISTGEDDVTVSLNGKEYRRKTSHGALRIPAAGAVVVHVAKAGFQPEPDQKVEIRKGEEAKVTFQMKPLPKVAALQIRNGVPGTQILLDDQPLGHVGPDGTLSAANLAPGEHSIEARREGFTPRKIQRSVKAGETLNVGGADLALVAANGTLHLAIAPPDATVSYRRADETQLRTTRETTLKLNPGNYVFVVRAPNHVERTVPATVVAGETRSVEISLVKVEPPKPRPAVTWAGWAKEGNDFVRKGGNRVVVCSGPMTGTLAFTAHLVKAGGVFRGARLRWFIDDGSGNTQYEVDKRHFQAKGPAGSRSKDLPKEKDEEDEKTYAIEIELTPDRIVHKVRSGGSWVTIDSQTAKVGTDNKFGFVIPGNDEIAISDLRFTPR